MYSPWHDWDSTLVTNRVMGSGIHRISLVYTVPTLQTMSTMLGFEVQQPGTDMSTQTTSLNFVPAAADIQSMAMFGVCLALAPRDRCMTRGRAFLAYQRVQRVTHFRLWGGH